MPAKITAFFDEPTATVVTGPATTRRCAVIDTVLDFDPKSGRTRTDSADEIINHVKARQLSVDWLLETNEYETSDASLNDTAVGSLMCSDRFDSDRTASS